LKKRNGCWRCARSDRDAFLWMRQGPGIRPTNIPMEINFDPVKNEKNIRERGLSFERAAEFDFESAIFLLDDRHDYDEVCRIAIGYLNGRLHILCFVEIPDGIRVVSFRKANAREGKTHGKPLTLNR
jgi:hypothetical protein